MRTTGCIWELLQMDISQQCRLMNPGESKGRSEFCSATVSQILSFGGRSFASRLSDVARFDSHRTLVDRPAPLLRLTLPEALNECPTIVKAAP
jgi:hypothetical protein